MLNRKIRLFLLLFILASRANAQNELIYHTDFTTTEYWGEGSGENETYTYKVVDGKLNMAGKRTDASSIIVKEIYIDASRDFSIETAAEHYSGPIDNSYGLIFGYKDLNNSFHFGVTPNGNFIVYYFQEGSIKYIIPWTVSNAIKTGSNVLNKLKVSKVGSQWLFYINGTKVAEKPVMSLFGNYTGFLLSLKQSIGYEYLTINYLNKRKPEPVRAMIEEIEDRILPQITITQPSITRGLKVVQKNMSVNVAGKATDLSGIYTVTVNGIQAPLDAEGNFLVTVPLAVGDNQVTVIATDVKMNQAKLQFAVNRPADVLNKPSVNAIPDIPVQVEKIEGSGKYYALLIGIQDYEDEAIPDLEQPVSDASTLYEILKSNYTFTPENIYLLKNPNRNQIFEALEKLSANVTREDNLLIFYAGHGSYDENKKQGYWYPSDARRNNRATWLTNADLTEYLTSIPSKHTLLITDACFAGSIFKTRALLDNATRDIKELYTLPSRKAMTSGTLKEVPDQSVFIEYLVKRLKQNESQYLSAEQLFSSFRTAVINNSANGQVPQFGEIKGAGDEGGDFIFIKK